MTQYYKMPGFSLGSANASTKVLLTLFLVSVLAGLGVSLLQYAERAGLGVDEAAEWVRGNEGDVDARVFRPEKSFGELVAITHEHAFALPMLLFVLLHLVALVTIGERAKLCLYAAGFLALWGALAGPWLVAYGGAGFAPLLVASGSLLCLVILVAACLCLFETWLAHPIRRWRKRPDPAAADPLVRKRPAAPGA